MTPIQRADSNYILDRSKPESDRLTRQHDLLKSILNRTSPLPSSIDPSSLTTVLDVGAGNLVWTLDLATLPQIRDRLSPTSLDPVKLYACDLSVAQFPPPRVTDEFGITVFQHDATLPFPDDLTEKFDLVYMRLLFLALTEEGWKKALVNVQKVLKPGGHLVLLDMNAWWFHPDRLLPEDWKYRESYMQNLDRSNWLDAFHDIAFPSMIISNGFIPDLVYRFPALLTSASLTVVSHSPLVSPIGKLCETHLGPYGQSMVSLVESTRDNFYYPIDAASKFAFKNGTFQSTRGSIYTEDERQQFINDLKKGLEEEGALTIYAEVIARK